MRLFGFTIQRAARSDNLQPVPTWGGVGSGRGWWPLVVGDHYTGAWQRNDELRVADVLAFSAVFACVTLIASDIGKLRVKLVRQDSAGIWSETDSPAFSPVLKKPNHFQTRIKFYEQWITSKLVHGNTYVLKERDQRGIVTAMTVLDPTRVKPLVTPRGDVYYQLGEDYLAGLSDFSDGSLNTLNERGWFVVPASEIIHDLMVPLYHPLVGVSPIYACGAAAMQGLKIQGQSIDFFSNGARPGGVLTAPGAIADETAQRLKEHFDLNYSGVNSGKVAVLGDGLKYEQMAVNAADAQLIEQLKWSAETVCSCFHVPPYMIGASPAPSYNNIESLNQQYYTQCLQSLIENLELSLDEGLGLTTPKDGGVYGTEFDLEGLLRMDTAAKVKAAADAIGAGFMSPNEARKQFDLAGVPGGSTPYLQQQNYSLAALDKRDSQADPFAKTPSGSGSSGGAGSAGDGTAPPPPADAPGESDATKVFQDLLKARLAERLSHAA